MSSLICTTVTGEKVAIPFRQSIKSSILSSTSSPSPSSSSSSSPPKLIGILANSDAPSRVYAEWTQKACKAVGIEYELREWDAERKGRKAGQGDVEEMILNANEETEVNGIMVYYPIFGPAKDDYLRQSVSPLKDVEGLNFTWLFSLYHNARFIDPYQLFIASKSLTGTPRISKEKEKEAVPSIEDRDGTLVKAILPCTPLGIVKTLEYCQVYNNLLPYGSRLFGKTITVINRSEVVGRPLAALLSNDGALVYSIDVDSIQEFSRRVKGTNEDGSAKEGFGLRHQVRELSAEEEEEGDGGMDKLREKCLRESDVVISGVPSKSYQIPTSSLKLGVICVNFSENKNFEPNVKEKAAIYCPGIGKVTIAMLQRNLLRLKEYQDKLEGGGSVVAGAEEGEAESEGKGEGKEA